jgi:structural maintenance of chromosomes protein 5
VKLIIIYRTYDELRYVPGKNLNIIIGPNGTGKSTIVAGIILGCGGKPALLSRSKDVCLVLIICLTIF